MGLSSVKFPYIVVLKSASQRPFNIFGFLLNLTSCFFFISEFAFVTSVNIFLMAGITVILGILAWNFFRLKNNKKVFFDKAYLVSALLWLKMPHLEWLFIAFVILALLEHQVKFPLEIGFSENQVVFNSLFRKRYEWAQLSNVKLKDGLLTIDFENNRLVQKEVVDEEDEDDATEEEFNEFCRVQLEKKN